MTVTAQVAEVQVEKRGRGRPKKDRKVYDPIQDAKDLVPFVSEALVVLNKMALLKEELKAVKTAAKETLGIESKAFNAVVKMRNELSRDVVEEQNEEILEIYDHAFPKN